jgi:hypothetical protein
MGFNEATAAIIKTVVSRVCKLTKNSNRTQNKAIIILLLEDIIIWGKTISIDSR